MKIIFNYLRAGRPCKLEYFISAQYKKLHPHPLVLPPFTRVDTALFYRLNKHVKFALNVDNLLDEVIFVNASVGSSIEIAAPRTTTFRTSFNF